MRFFTLVIIYFFLTLNSYGFTTTPYNEKNLKSVFPERITPPKTSYFIFDPNHLQWAVYDINGERVGSGKAVGGKNFCEDIKEPCRTVEGTYTVFRAGDHDCTSKTFPIDEGGGAPMPHCMFFYKGYAIHGSNNLPNKNASHGCIRVSKKAAEWMSTYYIIPGATVKVLPYASTYL